MKSLILALTLLAALPALAHAGRSEQGVFTVEVAGTWSAGWQSPGTDTCNAPEPEQARGSIAERGSFRTKEPVPITVQGLWGRDLTYFNMRTDDSGIPVDAELQRTG